MNQLPLAEVDQPAAVDSLFVELMNNVLLLPMSAVAEVVREVSPTPVDNQPAWVYGWLDWRKLKIPMISLEGLLGQSIPDAPDLANAVVLYTLENDSKLPFLAVLIQNFPSPVRLVEGDNLVNAGTGQQSRGVLMEVALDGEKAQIPDLEQIERFCLEQLSDWPS